MRKWRRESAALGAGKPGRGAALGLAVFRVNLAVISGESEGNLRGISGSGGAGTGAGNSAGEQIHGGPNGAAGGDDARTRGASASSARW